MLRCGVRREVRGVSEGVCVFGGRGEREDGDMGQDVLGSMAGGALGSAEAMCTEPREKGWEIEQMTDE